MGWFNKKQKLERTENIVVYYACASDEGLVTEPLGYMPRFSEDFEKQINSQRTNNEPYEYVGTVLDGCECSVMLCCISNRIDAIAFISENDARSYPNLMVFPEADLATFLSDDNALNHFPRRKFAQ